MQAPQQMDKLLEFMKFSFEYCVTLTKCLMRKLRVFRGMSGSDSISALIHCTEFSSAKTTISWLEKGWAWIPANDEGHTQWLRKSIKNIIGNELGSQVAKKQLETAGECVNVLLFQECPNEIFSDVMPLIHLLSNGLNEDLIP